MITGAILTPGTVTGPNPERRPSRNASPFASYSPRSSIDLGWVAAPRRVTGLQRFQEEISSKIPEPVRALLPRPSFLFYHPLKVVTARSLLSECIPRIPLGQKDAVLAIGVKPQVKVDIPHIRDHAEAIPSPGPTDPEALPSRSILTGLRQVIRARKATNLSAEKDNEGYELYELVEDVEDRTALSLLSAAADLRRRHGILGFYRGAISSHIISLLNNGIANQMTSYSRPVIQYYVGRSPPFDEESRRIEEPLPAIRTPSISRGPAEKALKFFGTAEGVEFLSRTLAQYAAGIVTYPLDTINYRQMTYEPYDGISIGFLEAARLTVTFDGAGALFNGLRSFVLGKALISAAMITGRGLMGDTFRRRDSQQILDQWRLFLETLFGPFLNHQRHCQAHSLMPGLATTCPSLGAKMGTLISGAALLEMSIHVGVLLSQVLVQFIPADPTIAVTFP